MGSSESKHHHRNDRSNKSLLFHGQDSFHQNQHSVVYDARRKQVDLVPVAVPRRSSYGNGSGTVGTRQPPSADKSSNLSSSAAITNADRKTRTNWDDNHNHQLVTPEPEMCICINPTKPTVGSGSGMTKTTVPVTDDSANSPDNSENSPWAAACLGNVVTCGKDVLYELDFAASKVYRPLRTEAAVLSKGKGKCSLTSARNEQSRDYWSTDIDMELVENSGQNRSNQILNARWNQVQSPQLRIQLGGNERVVPRLFHEFPWMEMEVENYSDDCRGDCSGEYESIMGEWNDSFDEGYDNGDEGIYDTLEPQTTSCPTCSGVYCNYTCHLRCRPLVALDCTTQTTPLEENTNIHLPFCEEETRDGGERVIIDQETNRSLASSWATEVDLRQEIDQYNASVVGSDMTLSDDGETFSGFVRVHMKLCRPINIVSGTRPPSIYDVLFDDGTESMNQKTLTSFYLPRDTVKAIHITSLTTTQEVISSLLKKFQVVDNPHKFALYERYYEIGESTRVRMRRIQDREQPLKLVLMWHCQGFTGKQLVLQENDTGDIPWEAFTLPELSNFLRMLEREEDEYLNQVRLKYKLFSEKLLEALNYCESSDSNDPESADSPVPPHRRHSDTTWAQLCDKRPALPPAVPVRSDSLPNRDGGRHRLHFALRSSSGTSHLASTESGFYTETDRDQSDSGGTTRSDFSGQNRRGIAGTESGFPVGTRFPGQTAEATLQLAPSSGRGVSMETSSSHFRQGSSLQSNSLVGLRYNSDVPSHSSGTLVRGPSFSTSLTLESATGSSLGSRRDRGGTVNGFASNSTVKGTGKFPRS